MSASRAERLLINQLSEDLNMYYIIEHKYVGPNPDQNIDADWIEIDTVPATTNSSHEDRIEGWCGMRR